MSLDGLLLYALTHELQEYVGGRINKIHQPSEHDLVLQIRGRGQSLKLLLSANPTYPRIYATDESFLNPLEAPMFCMLMRKHCEGGVIEGIEQVGMERILRMHIRQRDELGDVSLKTIVIELMGRHSNMILIDQATGTIIDGIHHVTPAISSYRIVMPGSSYMSPPEQHKLHPLTVTRSEFEAAVDLNKPAESELVAHFSGLSPLAAREIVYRSGIHSVDGQWLAAPVWSAFESMMEELRAHRFAPNVKEEASSGKLLFAVYALSHISGPAREFETVSSCLEHFYGDKAERDQVKQKTGDLSKVLQNEIGKNRKKLVKLQETIDEAKDADRYRKLGELLTASLYAISKGDTEVEVIDYYDEEQPTVTIALDPLLTPSENAQRYFKKYTKSKNSLGHAEEQMREAEAEIDYLENVLQQLQAASLRDITEIREELAEGGYVRERGGRKGRKRKKDEKPQLSCYVSSEGISILVGKNNKQNDYLTSRFASSADTWLHTKDIPGSHVVIRAADFGEATLREAAMLAAYHSQARASGNVPVDYTLIRHVHKPNGAKPGFVIYFNQKTLYVTPDEQAIKAMPVSVK